MATIAHKPTTATTAAVTTHGTAASAARYVFAGVRIALGWVFLWAFLDKLFGLGHETASKSAWINGGHPTNGFLKNAAAGPFKGFYNNLAGSTVVDTLFMLALLGIGIALILGIGMRIAAAAATVLLVMMFAAVLPPENNIFMDDHLIYAGTIVGLALTGAGTTFGLGKWWNQTALVKKAPWLK
jgi:thiosulfate dehydrogenase (quinone) large subunit